MDEGGKPLAGSTWKIQSSNESSNDSFEVTDCVADTPEECTGSDKNPAAGEFSVEGLDAGEYVLTEVKAPAGFNLCEVCKQGVEFTVLAGQDVTVSPTPGPNDAFVNERQGLPMLPLTGISAQTWVWVSGGLLVGLLLTAVLWLQGPKRKAG